MSKKNYYDILNIKKDATEQEIKVAFRNLAKKYHPDSNKNDPKAEEKFQEISEAYNTLSDKGKRQMYDQFGNENGPAGFGGGHSGSGFGGFQGFNGGSFDDIIQNIFRGQAGSGSQDRGIDLIQNVNITLYDVIFGKTITLYVNKEVECNHCHGTGAETPSDMKVCDMCHGRKKVVRHVQRPFGTFQSESVCPKCHGTGTIISKKCHQCKGSGYTSTKEVKKIEIPAGVEDGQRFLLKGYGKLNQKNGSIGDLTIQVNVQEHKYFTREDENLILEVPITLLDAMIGGIIEIPTFYGNVKIEIPTKNAGQNLVKIRNKGIPIINTKNFGDLYIRFKIQPITELKLNKEEKSLLEEIKKRSSPKMNADFCKKINSELA